MNTKKALSLFSVLALTATILPGVHADYDAEGNYTPPAKIARLMKLEPKIEKYLDLQIAKIQTIEDVQLKKMYLFEAGIKKQAVLDVFTSMQYAYADSQYGDYMSDLKTAAVSFQKTIKEAQQVKEQKINPFAITADEQTKVETTLLSTQKDIVGYLKKALQMYSDDMKQDNPSVIHFENEMGKVDVNFEKYSSILSWATGDQQLDVALTATADLNLPGAYEMDKSGNWKEGAKQKLNGTFKIDGTIKIFADEMFVTVNNYTLTATSDMKNFDKQLAEAKTYLDALKGKTVSIKMPKNSGTLDRQKMFASFKKVLDVLETQPLLTPYKKWNGSFALEPKKETIQACTAAVEGTFDETSYLEVRKSFRTTPVWYTQKDNGYELSLPINEHGTTGELKLTYLSGEYDFTSKFSSKTTSVNIEIKKDFFSLDANADGGMKANVLWKDGQFNATASGEGQNVEISGALTRTTADLKAKFNGKEVGTLVVKGNETHSEYELHLNFDIPSPWKLDWKGTVDIKHGTFTIEKPKDAIDIEKALPKTSTTPSSIDLNNL